MAQFVPNSHVDYPVQEPGGSTSLQRLEIPEWQAGLSVRFLRDTTRAEADAIRDPDRVQNLRDKNAWSTFYGTVGLSSSFFLTQSNFNREVRSMLQGLSTGSTFPEFGGGYHFADQDVLLNFSFRGMSGSSSGWEDHQRFERRSLVVEAAKVLTDFHGFAPFVGVGLSREWLSFED